MKSVLVLLALLAITYAIVEDEAFMSTYKVKVNKRGTLTDYPRAGDNVKVHYTVFHNSNPRADSLMAKSSTAAKTETVPSNSRWESGK